VQADELAFTPITRQAELVRNGEISPRELVEAYLERIGRIDPTINAFRVAMVERALIEAGQAEARRKEGDARPLLGVPIAIKDVLLTPTFARPPLRVGQLDGRGAGWTLLADTPFVLYTSPFNWPGQPAVSVPAGFGGDGLPLGVQLVGRANDEATLLSLAAQLEAERPWADWSPAIA
jgi:Asp-tRNA(Asn)/Glu-tRNA(Gln) amidotransferase A subunit family amidase